MMEKKTMMGAGVAAAAAVAGIAAVVRRSNGTVQYQVKPASDGWCVVTGQGVGEESRHGTKRDAVSAARELAASKAPSELVIYRLDGSVQDKRRYEV